MDSKYLIAIKRSKVSSQKEYDKGLDTIIEALGKVEGARIVQRLHILVSVTYPGSMEELRQKLGCPVKGMIIEPVIQRYTS